MHIRTNLWNNAFARHQIAAIDRAIEHAVFITTNEEATYRKLGGRAPGDVIFNPVAAPAEGVTPYPEVADDSTFRVACLSGYSYLRGIDRLLDIAGALRDAGRQDVRFVVAGDMRLTGALPGDLGRAGRRGGSLADVAAARGLGQMFQFLGRVDQPARVLAGCHLLAKPTREDNPWGRDILEAMGAGLPVISVGRDTTFVETGVTGILQTRFDAEAAARDIVRFADDRQTCASLGNAARARVARLCDPTQQAATLARLWAAVYQGASVAPATDPIADTTNDSNIARPTR